MVSLATYNYWAPEMFRVQWRNWILNVICFYQVKEPYVAGGTVLAQLCGTYRETRMLSYKCTDWINF